MYEYTYLYTNIYINVSFLDHIETTKISFKKNKKAVLEFIFIYNDRN
jgi:hypothetical protein